MSSDYINPFDSNNKSNFNPATPNNTGGNYCVNYRHISKELDKDTLEIQGKKAPISFSGNIHKITQEGSQTIKKKFDDFKKILEETSAKFKKQVSSEEIRENLHKFLTSKKLASIRELSEEQIQTILNKANKDNISLIEKLCLDKTADSQDIERFLNALNEHNLPLAKKLHANKNINVYDIVSILESTTQDNIEVKQKMYDFLRKNTKILCDSTDVIASVDENSFESKIKMYKFLKGKVQESNIASSGILTSTTKENFEAKLEAYKFFKESGGYREDDLLMYITYVNKFDSKTKEIVAMMIETGHDYGYYAQEILCDGEMASMKREMFEFLKKIDGFSNAQKMDVLSHINKNNFSLAKRLCTEFRLLPKSLIQLLSTVRKASETDVVELVNNPKVKTLLDDPSLVSKNNYSAIVKLNNSDLENLDELFKQVEIHRANALKNPQLYINGESGSLQETLDEVNDFFNANKISLAKMSAILDKEAINNLLRMRFDEADSYIKKFLAFDDESIKLLDGLANSCNIDGKPLMPTQKIELIDLLLGYKQNNLDTSKMSTMIEDGRIDIPRLNLDLLSALLKKCGLEDEEIANIPKEKLMQWDVNHIHLLANEVRSATDTSFKDILRIANLEDFKSYILDTSNKYGLANAKTKDKFKKHGLNYEAWINPNNENNVQFQTKDKNQENLAQIVGQLIEDIEALRQTPAKGFIDKQFAQFINGDKFVIPEEYATSKTKLSEFTKNLLKQLDNVFKRAQGNLDNPSKATTAQNTLTIKDHLNQRLADIEKMSSSKSAKTYDLTIKMWDRVPQKDIFQGNYSTCCIAMGGGNGSAMPHYLMNTSFNMIEIVDNKTNNTIGNALCYFVTDKTGKPALMIDNIEIKNSQRPSDEVGAQLRNAITQYAKNLLKEVGASNAKIYMGNSYNDVPFEDLRKAKSQLKFLGETQCDEIYMDAYGGWVSKDQYSEKLDLLKLGNSKN